MMKKARWYNVSGGTNYAKMPQLFFALITSHFIITYEEKHSFVEIFTQKYYYIALLLNAIMAYGLIWVVYRVTRGLDFYYSWNRSYKRRFWRQIIGGVIFPLVLAILLAKLYFTFYGINLLDTVYFTRYFKLIVLMVLLLNAYLFYEWSIKNRSKRTHRSALVKQVPLLETDKYNNDIACIFIENKVYFAYKFDGDKTIWDEPLTATISKLSPQQFYMVRSSFIVNRSAIADVVLISTKITKIVLKAPFNIEIEVSRRENAGFKSWMAKHKDQ